MEGDIAFVLAAALAVPVAAAQKTRTKSNQTNERNLAEGGTISRADAVQSIADAFNAADSDKNGVLSRTELAAVDVRTADEVSGALRAGPIKGTVVKGGRNPPGNARLIFGWGADGITGDGTVSREQWTADALALFDAADLNEDGTLDASENAAHDKTMNASKASWNLNENVK